MNYTVRISEINCRLLKALKQEVLTSETWRERKKYCAITFDEISLAPGLNYDIKADAINGFVDLGKPTNKFADHAVVFMIRGTVDDKKWQQLIGFYLCKGPVKTNELKAILKQMIAFVVDTGLIPVALVCEAKETFQSVLESLIKDTKKEFNKSDGVISLSGQDLSVIYDPFHLLKDIRNAFITNNILHNGNISKWRDLVDVYRIDRKGKSNILSGVKFCHVLPNRINKEKMETCIPLLSYKAAALLGFTSNFSVGTFNKRISETMANTSHTVLFFDKLLDSCNGDALKTSKLKKMRRAVTTYSEHHTFWKDAVIKLETMQFVTENQEVVEVPTLKNWITTVNSLQRLWDFFKSKKITTMRPAHFNRSIEGVLNNMRCELNGQSSCYHFTMSFISSFPDVFKTDWLCPRSRQRFQAHSSAYTMGWLVEKIFKKTKCQICQNCLTSEQGYGSHREYALFRQNQLKHPSKHVVRYFSIIEKETHKYLDKKPYEDNISKKVRDTITHKLPFNFLKCKSHKIIVTSYFIRFVIRLCVNNWCNKINSIMKGESVSRASFHKFDKCQVPMTIARRLRVHYKVERSIELVKTAMVMKMWLPDMCQHGERARRSTVKRPQNSIMQRKAMKIYKQNQRRLRNKYLVKYLLILFLSIFHQFLFCFFMNELELYLGWLALINSESNFAWEE